jgi:thiamine pyrophosphokinase
VEGKIPDLITGDLDSVNPKSVENLAKLGAKVVRTPDQNETDFTKALKQTVIWLDERNITVCKLLFLNPFINVK